MDRLCGRLKDLESAARCSSGMESVAS
jgi:hypothetical protein